jgi:hypothetical protein
VSGFKTEGKMIAVGSQ